MTTDLIIVFGALFMTVALALSFLLALAGEPSSVWLWSQVVRAI